MSIYIILNICIILFGWLSYLVVKKNPGTGRKNNGVFYVVLSFSLLVFISAFRGDFATDYKAYQYFFNHFKQFNILDIFHIRSWQEIGYTLFNIVIGIISQHELAIMVATSIVIIFLFYYRFIKDSQYIWLTILMFVSVGSYYTSFNMIRQMIAIAITFAGIGFLYEKKLVPYFLVVGLAATFHISALVMIPLGYMLTKFKPTLKNLLILVPVLIVLSFFIDTITAYMLRIFYQSYLVEGAYGMESINLKILVVPISIAIFVLAFRKKIDLKNYRNKIWINATIFYLVFTILSLNIKNFNRIAEYFLPFLYLIVPLVISKLGKKDRTIYLTTIPLLLTIYVLISMSGSGFDPYYFFWSN